MGFGMDVRRTRMKHLSDPLERRMLQLLRAYQRELGACPTVVERQMRDRAAALTARAEAALTDTGVSHEDAVRLDHAAEKARRRLGEAVAARKAEQARGPTLREYVASRTVAP
jgi:hypothetical protein